ncbi:MAG: hypothetical protein ACLR4A_10475 [Christensenellales bacterium]
MRKKDWIRKYSMIPEQGEQLLEILNTIVVRMKKAGISDDNIAINLKDKDVDILVHGFVPQDAKSWIRMIAYKTRLFKLYSLLYR